VSFACGGGELGRQRYLL